MFMHAIEEDDEIKKERQIDSHINLPNKKKKIKSQTFYSSLSSE